MSPANSYAKQVIELARTRGVKIATAESCTGGLIAGALTDIAGSSAVVDRGFVTYSNSAKMEMLEVSPETLQAHGAVSSQTAQQMAEGALAHSQASLTVSVTGIAGPGGGSADKPVGLVWFGLAQAGKPTRTLSRKFGDVGRDRVRALTVEQALRLLIDALG
ncbi:MAG: damage-inducible protein CinA [Oceanicaulis sp.]|uniref:CinA family protein n=1 Tax=unclassified Oceanicaulis TaxID=2632123 RepID=UPI000C37067A|nr:MULTISPECIES: CinA family protein [unclassified Oceanicaulis]MBC40073.1 damage-inducible protein CinA [Oceanicaulis sp.]MBG36942.1 damage-inducible protein CinA [Oceanicaulis sp.]|tara:strand:- start:8294 stop:8779 length:486 start_codon:yes stop_codon:yes gene_type:complete